MLFPGEAGDTILIGGAPCRALPHCGLDSPCMQFLLRVGLFISRSCRLWRASGLPFGVGIGSSKEREQRHSIALRISRRIEIRRVFLIAQNDALSVQWCSQAVLAGGEGGFSHGIDSKLPVRDIVPVRK